MCNTTTYENLLRVKAEHSPHFRLALLAVLIREDGLLLDVISLATVLPFDCPTISRSYTNTGTFKDALAAARANDKNAFNAFGTKLQYIVHCAAGLLPIGLRASKVHKKIPIKGVAELTATYPVTAELRKKKDSCLMCGTNYHLAKGKEVCSGCENKLLQIIQYNTESFSAIGSAFGEFTLELLHYSIHYDASKMYYYFTPRKPDTPVEVKLPYEEYVDLSSLI